MKHKHFATGALESPKDPRDWTPEAVGAATVLPDAIFIEEAKTLRVTDQGKIGSCVGNTFEEVMRLIRVIAGNQDEELSWRFVYAVCKAIEGTQQPTGNYSQWMRTATANDGTYPSLAAQVIRKYGVPLAKYCPNDVSLSPDDFCYGRVLSNIPQAAFDDALKRRAGADIAFPPTAFGIRQALAYAKENKGAVAILRRIGDTYWRANGVSTYDKAKLIPIAPPTTIVSGHEELLYGIDVLNGRDRIHWQNHWNTDWCSTKGTGTDGGRAWEYLDVWLPYIVEVRVVVPMLPPAPVTFRYTFTQTLKKGDRGADVVALQHILDLEGCYNYNPTDGSTRFTGLYGDKTSAGVKQLQEKYAAEILAPVGLSVGTGNFGNSTMKWMNAKYGLTS